MKMEAHYFWAFFIVALLVGAGASFAYMAHNEAVMTGAFSWGSLFKRTIEPSSTIITGNYTHTNDTYTNYTNDTDRLIVGTFECKGWYDINDVKHYDCKPATSKALEKVAKVSGELGGGKDHTFGIFCVGRCCWDDDRTVRCCWDNDICLHGCCQHLITH